MSYIGQNLPSNSFEGYTTDTFAGDGSATTFTMSKAPFNESAVIVVINNVIQKPTTNFTVSGTTLTIVGTAVASGDVIYATHTGGAIPINTASALDLNGASDQLILDADADTTLSADTDDQIDIKIAGADDIKITANKFELLSGTSLDMDGLSTSVAAGDVMFQGGKVGNHTLTNGTYTKLSFSSEGFDRGSNFASDKFVAPKAGVYLIHAGFRPNNFAVDRLILIPYKNGTNVGGNAQTNTGELTNINAGEYPFVQVSNLLSLSASDEIEFYGYQNTGGDQTVFQSTLYIIRLGTYN